jgi:hypothetical protein
MTSALRFMTSALRFMRSALRFMRSALRFMRSALRFMRSALRFMWKEIAKHVAAPRQGCNICRRRFGGLKTLQWSDGTLVRGAIFVEDASVVRRRSGGQTAPRQGCNICSLACFGVRPEIMKRVLRLWAKVKENEGTE